MRTVLAALLAVVALLASSDSAHAAAPRFIIVHGPLLDEPVLLDDWEENAALMLAMSEPVQIEVEQLEERRYLDFAMFWGPDWLEYPRGAEALARLSPEQANQHGRFYPVVRSLQPALFVLEDASDISGRLWLRVVEPRALAILEAHGVPTRIEREEPSSLVTPFRLSGAILTLAVAGVLVAVLVVRRRRTSSRSGE